ncbi:DUF3488 and transglutaminase-like domain-containing protein [Thalassotalea sp. 1_MG-2023]|uniref:transglutaminase family protein n=1 Tax=Thalassotalea sp. 1_MG-2023 TaxID=3062680 RepID=UPI0026E2B356|nr:DUF3488 and transglutaminase-like domain-containing protein [Thalassotalea sp. 1_MG-2023]MDO6428720.1 DUF3488 and transglutaminase-like domain-containing protein [Thalassotalea sp. 1_MG-2023]
MFSKDNKKQMPVISSNWLLLLPVLNLSLLTVELSQWFIAMALITLLWQWAIHRNIMAIGKGWIKVIIAIAGCVLLVLTGKAIGLLSAMLHLLCLSYLLKPLELKKRYDLYQWYLIGLLLLSCSLIFQQSIYFALLVLVIFLANLMFLSSLFSPFLSVNKQTKFSLKLVAQSLPLAVLLFVVFPKIPPFWQVPQSKGVETGLNDSLKIGDIAKLALSNALAFRVEFSGEMPNYQQLYWRAIVLDVFDGKEWKRRYQQVANIKRYQQVPRKRLKYSGEDQLVSYQVILTPSFQPWLFLLDVGQLNSNRNTEHLVTLRDYSLYSPRKITRPMSYQVTSNLTQSLTLYHNESVLQRNLRIDRNSNPKLYNFGQTLKESAFNAQNIIDSTLQHYRSNPFRYTLEPPLLTNNSLDEFFFKTQAGFCEHYASSFTYLMRAAGIPARVVLGYLGGELNEQGGYFSVYQRDAHAWSEVWLDGKGWVRVDPTAAVDPSRVEQGFSSQLLKERDQLAGFDMSTWLQAGLLQTVQLYLDTIDYQWTKFVINYSTEQQFKLLKSWFGQHVTLKVVVVLLLALSLIVALFFITRWLRRFTGKESSPALRIYESACQHIEKLGVTRNLKETDQQYISRVKKVSVAASVELAAIFTLYNQYVYANKRHSSIINALKKRLTKLKSVRKQEIDR